MEIKEFVSQQFPVFKPFKLPRKYIIKCVQYKVQKQNSISSRRKLLKKYIWMIWHSVEKYREFDLGDSGKLPWCRIPTSYFVQLSLFCHIFNNVSIFNRLCANNTSVLAKFHERLEQEFTLHLLLLSNRKTYVKLEQPN